MELDAEALRVVEQGMSSPTHAVQAVEYLARRGNLSRYAVAEATGARPQPPELYQKQGPRPLAADASQPHARAPMIQPQEMVAELPQIVAPTQWPPVVDARNHPPAYAQTVQPMLSPDLWLVVPNIPVVTAGNQSGALQFDFSLGNGIIIGIRGSAQIADLDPPNNAPVGLTNQIQLRLSINGSEFLMSNGGGADWVSFSDLFGGDAVQWTPVNRRVLSSDKLQVEFNNLNQNAVDIQPTLVLAYRRLPMPV